MRAILIDPRRQKISPITIPASNLSRSAVVKLLSKIIGREAKLCWIVDKTMVAHSKVEGGAGYFSIRTA